MQQFRTLTNSFLTVFAAQSGSLDFDTMRASHNPWAAMALAFLYAFIMGMVLLNLLIGVLSNSLAKASAAVTAAAPASFSGSVFTNKIMSLPPSRRCCHCGPAPSLLSACR